jgi:hypothetical protein
MEHPKVNVYVYAQTVLQNEIATYNMVSYGSVARTDTIDFCSDNPLIDPRGCLS